MTDYDDESEEPKGYIVVGFGGDYEPPSERRRKCCGMCLAYVETGFCEDKGYEVERTWNACKRFVPR